MKTYSANDHAKLDTAERKNSFIKFMELEYAGYIDSDSKRISAHNDGDFDWFVGEWLKWFNTEETLCSVETKGGSTWYVDFQRRRNLFNVHQDEKFRVQRKTMGEALEYIFNALGGKAHLKFA